MGDKSSLNIVPRGQLKYAPKIPSRRTTTTLGPKTEPLEASSSDVIDHELLRLVKQAEQGSGRRVPKAERKAAPVEVAFGHVDARTAARSFGIRKIDQKHDDGAGGSVMEVEKEYDDPWDYETYYPVTLPLRRPHSGNPELLDEEEFGEASASTEYDETSINPAEELGLMESGDETRMLFFQLPTSLPLPKRSVTAADAVKGKEIEGRRVGISGKGCSLEDLPAGFMGKLLVYKSGIVKMKLGDAVFDVTPGSNCGFAQDVMAINTQEKHCCVLGELNKRAIVKPDIDSLLGSVTELD